MSARVQNLRASDRLVSQVGTATSDTPSTTVCLSVELGFPWHRLGTREKGTSSKHTFLFWLELKYSTDSSSTVRRAGSRNPVFATCKRRSWVSLNYPVTDRKNKPSFCGFRWAIAEGQCDDHFSLQVFVLLPAWKQLSSWEISALLYLLNRTLAGDGSQMKKINIWYEIRQFARANNPDPPTQQHWFEVKSTFGFASDALFGFVSVFASLSTSSSRSPLSPNIEPSVNNVTACLFFFFF